MSKIAPRLKLEVVEQQATTKENVNKLIEFRQAVENGTLTCRDALFNLLDVLVCEGSATSFARLSQLDRSQRKWSSVYTAAEDGDIDSEWLRTYLAEQVPPTGICVYLTEWF
jgi:hypothetical protein